MLRPLVEDRRPQPSRKPSITSRIFFVCPKEFKSSSVDLEGQTGSQESPAYLWAKRWSEPYDEIQCVRLRDDHESIAQEIQPIHTDWMLLEACRTSDGQMTVELYAKLLMRTDRSAHDAVSTAPQHASVPSAVDAPLSESSDMSVAALFIESYIQHHARTICLLYTAPTTPVTYVVAIGMEDFRGSTEALHVAWSIASSKDNILVVHAEGRNDRRPPTPVGERGKIRDGHTIGGQLLDVVVQMCNALYAKRRLRWKVEELKSPAQNPMAVYFQVEDYVSNKAASGSAAPGSVVLCIGSGAQALGTVTRYFVDNVNINLIICKPLDFFGDRLPVLEFQRAMRIHTAWNKMEYFDLDRCVFDFLPLLPARKAAPSVHGPFQLPDHYTVRDAVEHLRSQALHSAVASSGEYFDCMDVVAVLAEEPTLGAAKRKLRGIRDAPASTIANHARRSVTVTVSNGTPLRAILELICGHSSFFKKSGETRPCRRVVIADDGVLVQVFGAAQILDICCCFTRLTALLKRRADVSKAVQWPENYALESHEPLMKAIRRMHRWGLTLVPVMEKKLLRGDIAMLGAISSSDLRHVLHDADRLSMSCGDFICLCSQQIRQNTSSFDKSRYPFISVKADSEVYAVAQKLLSTRVHRVFLVNEKKIPVGIVSARDIVKLIYHEIVQLDEKQKRCHDLWKFVGHLSTTVGAWARRVCDSGLPSPPAASAGISMVSRRSKSKSARVKWRDQHANAALVEEIEPAIYTDIE